MRKDFAHRQASNVPVEAFPSTAVFLASIWRFSSARSEQSSSFAAEILVFIPKSWMAGWVNEGIDY
jgi:hypothetical protein